jgi:uncharacterized protein YuzE
MRDTGREMTMSYDKLADVLYVMFEPAPPDSYLFVENAEGDVLKVDRVSKRVVGCTILSFAARTRRGSTLVVPEVGSVPFNEVIEELVR